MMNQYILLIPTNASIGHNMPTLMAPRTYQQPQKKQHNKAANDARKRERQCVEQNPPAHTPHGEPDKLPEILNRSAPHIREVMQGFGSA